MRELTPSIEANTCAKGHLILKESCKACLALKKEWDTYLKNTGFNDIESKAHIRDAGSIEDLKARRDFTSQHTFEARLSYYQWARSMMIHGKFDTRKDKIIWENYAEGATGSEISKFIGLEKSYVTRKILKIKHSLVNQVVGSVQHSEKIFFFGYQKKASI